jgi:DivIVA domain-containing protein
MTGDDIRRVEFREAFRGYSIAVVDRRLDEIASAIDRGERIRALDLTTEQIPRQWRGYRSEDVDALFDQLRLDATG